MTAANRGLIALLAGGQGYPKAASKSDPMGPKEGPEGHERDSKGRQDVSPSAASQQLLSEMKESCSFDVLRDVRRTACYYSLGPSTGPPRWDKRDKKAVEGNNSFYSFVLGASSCGTAMECVLQRHTSSLPPHSDNQTGSAVLPDIGLPEISRSIKSACCSDPDALVYIESILDENVRFCTAGGDAVCFAVIEPVSRNLILGRWDSEGSSVVCLSVADELSVLLARWSVCMEDAKALLHRTSDPTSVAAWSDGDKRAWWGQRMASDALIDSLLCDLEDLLSPSISILTGPSSGLSSGLSSGPTKGDAEDLGCDSRGDLDKNSSIDNAKNGKNGKKLLKSNVIDIWADTEADIDGFMQESFSALSIEKSETTKSKAKVTPMNTDIKSEHKTEKKTEHRSENNIEKASGNVASTLADREKQLNLLKVTDLQQLLKDKMLAVRGKKSELIARLLECQCAPPLHRIYEDPPMRMCEREDPVSICVRSADPHPAPIPLHTGSTRPLEPPEPTRHIGPVPTYSTDTHGMKGIQGVKTSPSHTILILDEKLQQIPWEALPSLRRRNCSRIPSFALLLHMLTRNSKQKEGHNEREWEANSYNHSETQEEGERKRDLKHCVKQSVSHSDKLLTPDTNNFIFKRTWYALDPEGNLPATRETMSTFLQPFIDIHSWPGFVGEMPAEEDAKYVFHSFFFFFIDYQYVIFQIYFM